MFGARLEIFHVSTSDMQSKARVEVRSVDCPPNFEKC